MELRMSKIDRKKKKRQENRTKGEIIKEMRTRNEREI